MALGGGTFTVQNKELPGAYINFVSAASANAALSDRGIATMPLELDWGRENEVFEVTNEDFLKNSLEIFGYEYSHEKLKGLRDLFLNAKTLYAYRLNSGGEKASNNLAVAVCGGSRGNDLKIVVQQNVDNENLFDVKTLLGNIEVDEQTVESAEKLVDNSFVKWKKDTELELTAGMPLEGGTDGEVNGAAHQTYLDKIESYTYNVMGVTVTDEVTKSLYTAYNKRLRDEMGIKFQLVLYRKTADYYGVISVKNKVLDDINTMVTVSDTQGEIFKDNQTVRVIDQIANDIAVLFNTKYLGVVPNDAAGRISLWSDIVKHHEQLREIRAIENFSDKDVTVTQGNTKKSVVVTDLVTVVNAMGKLYMTVTVQ